MKKTIFILLNILSCAFCLSNKITQQPFMFKKSTYNGICSTSNIENYDNNFNDRSVNYDQDTILIPNYYYFENLHNYHGLNDSGICMIISAQIMLGYYDTFVNDKLVDESFDKDGFAYHSANLLSEYIQSPGTGLTTEDQRFRDYLINLSNDVNGSSPFISGLSNKEQKKLISSYLDNSNLSYSINFCQGTLNQDWNGEAKALIKSTIDSGRPVIANSADHSYVAFGYSENNVYVHTGWGHCSALEWSTFESPFPLIRCIGALDIVFSCVHFHSDNYHSYYYDKCYCPCGYSFNEIVLNPVDYGFQPQYYFYHRWEEINISNCTFDTHRLRTGYIENEFVNLSPRREDAGIAYLEYYLPVSIKKIVVYISFWGPSEQYNPNIFPNHSARIQYGDQYGIFYNAFDLLHDVSLSTDRTNQNLLQVSFPQGTTSFRFYTVNDAVGDRNRGRISIGKLRIVYE